MREIIRIIIYGFLTWLIPFLVAIPFYTPDGILLINQQIFKSIMIVTGSVVGAVLIVHLFKTIKGNYRYVGYGAGIVWLLMNWVLDILILVPLSGTDIPSYFGDIGLRYLVIPVMTIMAAEIAQHASEGCLAS